MNLFATSGLLIGTLCAILGILTFIRGKRLLHYIWGLFSFSVALWGFGSYKIAIISNPGEAILWWRIAYVGVILIPVFFTHFIYKFLNISKKWLIRIIYLIGLFFLVVNFINGLFIKEVLFVFNQFYYLSSPPILYTIFVILFFGLVVYSHIKLLQAYRISKGIQRTQIRYFLFATIPGFLSGIFEFLPVYKIDIYPYLHFIIALSPITVAYAILRYRLMDIRIVVRKLFVYLGMAGLTYGMFYLVIWFFNKFFGSVYNSTVYAMGVIIAPIFVAIFYLISRWVQVFANKYLFYSLYSYQETISKLTDELNKSIDLDKIIGSIVDTIKSTMQLDRAGVLLINKEGEEIRYQITKVIGFNEKNGISLVQDNFLTRYLQRTQKPLVREELSLLAKDTKIVQDKQNFEQLSENMKRIEASLCLPMLISGKLIGIIVLGSKVSGDAYTKEDLDLLITLSKQAAIAVDNARLYKEVQDFNKTLQQKVDEQTKDIKQAYEIEKKAKEDLQKLDEQKNEFMLITQHHLRTPLTSMMGYMDLIDSGTFGKVPKKLGEIIHKFGDSSQNLIKIVNEFLDLSQFQMGKQVVSLQDNVDVKVILEKLVKELNFEAEKKGISLNLEKPKEDISPIKADPSKLQMALFNVIDNSIKYTQKGGITIQVKNKITDHSRKIEIIVKDTGIGMEKKDIDNLFSNLLVRGEGAKKVNVTGRGIGLFLSAKIIEAHNGKIWAESEGQGKGSTFYIELPIEQQITL